jgi:hypothetical protein
MLTKILSVTGKPGLYKLISTNKNMNVVESLADGKRIPVYMHEKIVALSDVSIYTNEGDTPLRDVLKSIKEKESGNKVTLGAKSSGKDYFNYLEEVLPNYNKESVYASDVKKIVSWYNILMENDIDLEEEVKEEGAEGEVSVSEGETKEEKAKVKEEETSEEGAEEDGQK